MVKTPFGRKPSRRHARIVKKLRHRRRMAAAQMGHEMELLSASTPDTVSTASSTYTVSTTSTYTYSTASTSSSFSCGYGIGKAPSLDSLSVSTAADAANDDDGFGVLEHSSTAVPVKKTSNRGVSQSEAAVVGPKNVDRASVSESGLHDAIPMPPPSTPTEELVITRHYDQFDGDRMQHPDEETDRYLAHLFAPSVANMNTTTAGGEIDTRSDEFQRLRNLFSSVVSDNTSSTRPETLPGLRHVSSHDTTYGLRSLFEPVRHGVRSAVSEQSLGLNTLFNNTQTLENGISCDTSMGLRTLFEEGQHQQPHSTASTLGLRTLFHQEDNEEEDEDQKTSTIGNLLRSTASTLGLRTLFNHDDNKEEEDEAPKSISHMPSLTSSASTILGNLFGSEHTIHRGNGGTGEEEMLSAKERMKVLIVKDLAEYLDGADDGTSHGRPSSSLSTFVHQIDNLFANYRIAVAHIGRLEKELSQMKKDQKMKK